MENPVSFKIPFFTLALIFEESDITSHREQNLEKEKKNHGYLQKLQYLKYILRKNQKFSKKKWKKKMF